MKRKVAKGLTTLGPHARKSVQKMNLSIGWQNTIIVIYNFFLGLLRCFNIWEHINMFITYLHTYIHTYKIHT